MTFTTQSQDWLAASPGLSQAATAAYRGEVNRLAEFMAVRGIRGVRQMRETHWLDYLAALMQDRVAISSRRRTALKVTSALQAARITRLFLRHCYAQGWIVWVPVGPRRCALERSSRQATMPLGLVELLLGPTSGDQEKARALSAISLAFWGALTPREIAAARVGDLRALDEMAELTVAGRSAPIILPQAAMRHIKAYNEIRRELLDLESHLALPRSTPLISHLDGLASVTAHRVWTLLKAWPPDAADSEIQIALGARTLRDCFLALASHDGVTELAAVRRQAGRLDVSALRRHPVGQTSTSDVVERVTHNLESLQHSKEARGL